MPDTFSIVLSTKKSGAISIMPPMATTRRMPMRSSIELRSNTPWSMSRRLQLCGGGKRQGFRAANVPADRSPQIVRHDHRTDEIEEPSQRADHIVGMRGRDRLHE